MTDTIDLDALERLHTLGGGHPYAVPVERDDLAALIKAVRAALRLHTDCTWDELEETLAPFRREETSAE